jgi:hypothetical protein
VTILVPRLVLGTGLAGLGKLKEPKMPKKVHDLAKKLQKKGYSESSSWAIANSALKIKKKGKKK